ALDAWFEERRRTRARRTRRLPRSARDRRARCGCGPRGTAGARAARGRELLWLRKRGDQGPRRCAARSSGLVPGAGPRALALDGTSLLHIGGKADLERTEGYYGVPFTGYAAPSGSWRVQHGRPADSPQRTPRS